MTFANPLPWWALVLVSGGAALIAWMAYRNVAIPPRGRLVLSTLRLLALLWLVICLMRPVARPSEADIRDAVVPVVIDISRSMGLADVPQSAGGKGETRIDYARRLIQHELMPALSARFQTELLRFGEQVRAVDSRALTATDRRTALGGALQAVRDRYRGRAVAGIVLVTDGGDNGDVDPIEAVSGGPPVYPIGIGPRSVVRDREIVSITAAESVLTDALVDIDVAAVAHGYGRTPFDLRLLENGRLIDARRVTPAADGVPVSETFHVSPSRDAPTVYSVEVPAAANEITSGNNTRSALVPRPARPRRVLLVEGAPGFEHSFLKRALEGDRALEVDSVVRKGRDDSGVDTFYVQAARARAGALTGGYPKTREALFAYDVIVLANVDTDLLRNAELNETHAFVSERGGGLLVLGARAFQRQRLRGTALEDVLPLDLAERAGGVLPASASPGMNRVALTSAGEAHPMMQLASTPDESARQWAAVPALASVSALGGPRPGAAVLAVSGGPGGVPRALIAVQRYGEGRSMVFTGEAAWRWRMMLPASDQSYDRFWRQAARWLGQAARDRVSLILPLAAAAGDTLTAAVDVRDPRFAPQPDATVSVRVTSPDGRVEAIQAEPVPLQAGRYRAAYRTEQPGIYRITADAQRSDASLGNANGAVLVGSVDPEMIDPRLNEDVLQRVARASGGLLVGSRDIATLVDRLRANAPIAALALRKDLWHTGWSFAVIAMLLGAEWITRRRWGLR